MKIEPLNKVVGSLFGESSIFVVPKYQRAYSWQLDNVEEFCDDIKYLYDQNKQGLNTEHFLGSFVCVCLPPKALDEKRIYQLVDGQQRLSTICLLASRVIYKIQNLVGDEEFKILCLEKIKKIKKKFVFYYPEENDKYDCARVQLSRKDQKFYEELITNYHANYEKDKSPISHKLLLQAADYIDKWLIGFDGENNNIILNNLDYLVRSFSNSCRIINILMDTQSEAYKIFQVINDRGRSLSTADLLRATTLGMMEEAGATDEQMELAENYWNEISTDGDKTADYILQTYYISRKARKINKSTMYDVFISEFFENKNVSLITKQIEDILESKKTIELIKDGEWPFLSSSRYTPYQKNKLANIIRLFKHTQSIALLLSASRHKEKKFYHLIFIIEKFFFRFKVISGRRFDPAAKAYYELIKEINKMGDMYHLQKFMSSLSVTIKDRSPDHDVLEYVDNISYDVNGDNRILKFLLLTIEEGWDWAEKNYPQGFKGLFKYHINDLTSSPSNVSIEHIYSQNSKTLNVDLEEYKHKIGNLCLLNTMKNSIIGDNDFNKKSNMYKTSGFNTTIEISNNDTWNISNIHDHQKNIKEKSLKIFNL